MICPHCGAYFCPDTLTPTALPQIYCGQNCGKYASRKRTGRKSREQLWSRRRQSDWRSCGGKIPYEGVAEAGAVLLRMRYQVKGMAGGVYECLACGRWHVTGSNTERE